MTDQSDIMPPAFKERRTMRWLLGGQIIVALFLILTDVGSMLPTLFTPPSNAPELMRPTQPGDQTRRYRPSNPSSPGTGIDPDMPSQLVLTTDGLDAVTLRGAIAPGDAARINAELNRISPQRVTLDSPGGSVLDAVAIGRLLRILGVTTQIEDVGVCFSACPYVFVGGAERRVEDGGRLGVHQHSFGESTILPAFLATRDIQSGQAQILDHLDKMGIDLRLMGPAMATPANEIYILSDKELLDWNVISDDL